MIFQKKTSYPNYSSNSTLSSKKKLLIAIVCFMVVALTFVALTSRSDPQDTKSALTETSLSALSNKQIIINYPKDFKLNNADGKFTFTPSQAPEDEAKTPLLSVYPYASNLGDLDKLEETTTKDISGDTIATAKKITINGKDALWVTHKKDKAGKITQKLFVVSDEFTWLVQAEYYSEKDSLGKNVAAIFNSFQITSEE